MPGLQDLGARREGERSFDHVAQLAHVAPPGVLEQRSHGVGREHRRLGPSAQLAREVAGELTIQALLATLGLGDRPVAVERNALIVPRAEHASTKLADGDKLEVVQFVGGG